MSARSLTVENASVMAAGEADSEPMRCPFEMNALSAYTEATVVTSFTTTGVAPSCEHGPKALMNTRSGFMPPPAFPPLATRYIWASADGHWKPAGSEKDPWSSVTPVLSAEGLSSVPAVCAAYRLTCAPLTGRRADCTVPTTALLPDEGSTTVKEVLTDFVESVTEVAVTVTG